VPLAIVVLLSPDLQQDRLYSKNPLSWRLVTTTAGYFVYDLYVHTVRYEFLPSLVHAGAALVVFLSGIYCGILHYYGEPRISMQSDRQLQITSLLTLCLLWIAPDCHPDPMLLHSRCGLSSRVKQGVKVLRKMYALFHLNLMKLDDERCFF